MIAEPQRGFRRHIASAFALRCLHDFAGNCQRWLTATEFAERHIDYTLVSVKPYRQYQWLLKLHAEATQVFERLCVLCAVPVDIILPQSTESSVPRVGTKVGDRIHWFPQLPRLQLRHLVRRAS
ncbi:hypothetical protein Plhal304r1_c019g0070171 [Plasmopara halstedii]